MMGREKVYDHLVVFWIPPLMAQTDLIRAGAVYILRISS